SSMRGCYHNRTHTTSRSGWNAGNPTRPSSGAVTSPTSFSCAAGKRGDIARERLRRKLHPLAPGQVRMERGDEVLGGEAELDGEHGLPDHVAGVRRYDVYAQEPVRRRIGDELEGSVRP